MVSICCLTYNHRDFIGQALDGFVMQLADFDFEIIVHDDASTEGTAEIVKEYAARFPWIIKPVFQAENTFSRTGRYPMAGYVYPRAQGRYIAECDGDDYWTDRFKLQKQVDFLEAHPEYVMCHHDYMILQRNELRSPSADRPRDYTREELIAYHYSGYGIGACTKLFRNVFSEKTRADFEKCHGDYPMNVMLGLYGGCKYIPGIFPSVYRKHKTNSWANVPQKDMREKTMAMQKRICDWLAEMKNEDYMNLRKPFFEEQRTWQRAHTG